MPKPWRFLKNNIYERLRERLDQKDAKIRRLQDAIQAERENRDLELTEVGSVAEAALKLNSILDAAQKAADQYLRSIQAAHPMQEQAVIERLSREACRRTRAVDCFPDGSSALTFACARSRHVAGTRRGGKIIDV